MLNSFFIFNGTQTAAAYREALDLIWSSCELQLSGCVAKEASVSPAACSEVRGGGKAKYEVSEPHLNEQHLFLLQTKGHHLGSSPVLRTQFWVQQL